MEFMPVFLRLRGRSALLVGGGGIALRKARLLSASGAAITVLAPAVQPELEQLALASGGAVICDVFSGEIPGSPFVIVAATGVDAVDRAVADAADARGTPVNVVDTPERCSFIVPSIIDRSPLMIAISSGGAAPVLVRKVREQMESLLPARLGRLAQWLGARRSAIKAAVPDMALRLRLWEKLVHGRVADRMLAGDEPAAQEAFMALLEQMSSETSRGEVYLVGAGPGDPDLLTFKALRLMQQADIVFFDRLVSQPIIDLVRRDAERVYVGKKRDDHVIPQQEINRLLVEHARSGKRVLRLKGGDPFIFGRGGEEIEQLAEAGIPFQVVPGITAASGCASYAGIPLTHRDHAQSVRFVTGHLKNGELALDWDALARPEQTLVFYMGLVSLNVICRELVAHGMDADMPAALVESGTMNAQRVVAGTVASLPKRAEVEQIGAPSLLIIGTVVELRQRLSWFRPASDQD